MKQFGDAVGGLGLWLGKRSGNVLGAPPNFVSVPLRVCLCAREFIHERHYRSPGRKAGHSWPQGSPDYVYDSGAIIRAGYEGQTIHANTHRHTEAGPEPRCGDQRLT